MNDQSNKQAITARWVDSSGNLMEAPVVNPGDWFGKTWLLSMYSGSYGGPHYIVEADHLSDAIDILAEDDTHGDCIRLDLDIDGDDYGEPLSDGLELSPEQQEQAAAAAIQHDIPVEKLFITLNGNFTAVELEPARMSGQGVWYDDTDLTLCGKEGSDPPFPVRYYGRGLPADGVQSKDFYSDWDWNEEREEYVLLDDPDEP